MGWVGKSNLEWNSIIYNVKSFGQLHLVRLDDLFSQTLSKYFREKMLHPLKLASMPVTATTNSSQTSYSVVFRFVVC